MLKPKSIVLVRILTRNASALAEAIKETLAELKPNLTLLMTMTAKLCWLIPLTFCPNLFNTFPSFYVALRLQGPQWAWAFVILSLIAMDAVALALKAFKYQVGPLLVSTVFWSSLATIVSYGVPRGLLNCPASPAFFLCWALAIGSLIGVLLRAIRFNADNFAHDLEETKRTTERSPLIHSLTLPQKESMGA